MSENLFDGPHPAAGHDTSGWFTAHCDGGSRGNPGPAGYGAVIENPQGRIVARLSEYLGKQTNNHAEYSGLVSVLKWASQNGARRLRVVSDSELMVKQMKGQYRVKNPGLLPLWQQARNLARSLDGFEIEHTLRAGNAEADRLANEAMDRGMGKIGEQESGTGDQATAPILRSEKPAALKPERQILEGYVKDGVVHLLGGELPDGIFVKVIRE